MQVSKLTIKKQESYEPNAGQLVGAVVLEGPTGKQEIVLSAMAMSRIFGVIAEEMIERSRSNAKMVRNAVEEAIHEPLLLNAAEISPDDLL